MWCCEWSVDDLGEHRSLQAESIGSLNALSCALTGISSYLHARQKHGDRFYMSRDEESDEIKDLDLIFPRLKIEGESWG